MVQEPLPPPPGLNVRELRPQHQPVPQIPSNRHRNVQPAAQTPDCRRETLPLPPPHNIRELAVERTQIREDSCDEASSSFGPIGMNFISMLSILYFSEIDF